LRLVFARLWVWESLKTLFVYLNALLCMGYEHVLLMCCSLWHICAKMLVFLSVTCYVVLD
jgi:hypothetical protein